MTMRLHTRTFVGLSLVAAALIAGPSLMAIGADEDKPKAASPKKEVAPKDAKTEKKPAANKQEADKDPAVERAREQVQMLDHLYKNAVVSITKRYVSAQGKQPAIMVAQDVFGAMDDKGWHSAKVIDATGEPMNEMNAPETDFEKAAAKAMNSGEEYYEVIVGEGDNRRLLAATVVPVVMNKCATCHTNRKVGEVLGFIRYDVPIK